MPHRPDGEASFPPDGIGSARQKTHCTLSRAESSAEKESKPTRQLPPDLGPPTPRAVLAVLADGGFVVGVGLDGDATVVTATDQSGECWTVRGPDVYAALGELAEQVGIDLADG